MLIVNQDDPDVITEAERILYYKGERYRGVMDGQTPVTDLEGPFVGLRQETIDTISTHVKQTEMDEELYERLVQGMESFKHCEYLLEPIAGGQFIREILYVDPKILQADQEDARERTLDALRQWREADERLEALCKELGIDKPVLVM